MIKKRPFLDEDQEQKNLNYIWNGANKKQQFPNKIVFHINNLPLNYPKFHAILSPDIFSYSCFFSTKKAKEYDKISRSKKLLKMNFIQNQS